MLSRWGKLTNQHPEVLFNLILDGFYNIDFQTFLYSDRFTHKDFSNLYSNIIKIYDEKYISQQTYDEKYISQPGTIYPVLAIKNVDNLFKIAILYSQTPERLFFSANPDGRIVNGFTERTMFDIHRLAKTSDKNVSIPIDAFKDKDPHVVMKRYFLFSRDDDSTANYHIGNNGAIFVNYKGPLTIYGDPTNTKPIGNIFSLSLQQTTKDDFLQKVSFRGKERLQPYICKMLFGLEHFRKQPFSVKSFEILSQWLDEKIKEKMSTKKGKIVFDVQRSFDQPKNSSQKIFGATLSLSTKKWFIPDDMLEKDLMAHVVLHGEPPRRRITVKPLIFKNDSAERS